MSNAHSKTTNPTPRSIEKDMRKRRRIGIRAALLLAVNAVLLVGFAVLLVADYQRGLAERMDDKQTAMADEAALVLPAVTALRHHGNDAVQRYIDLACAQMQDTVSPGHHIVVKIGDTVLQAQTHQRASPDFTDAMRLASQAPDHRARVDGRPILVGTRGDDQVRVYVSEFTTNVRGAARAELVSRAVGIALIGLLLAVILNVILLRLVTRPIARLVQTVHRIGGGELGVSPPHFVTSEMDFLAAEIGAMGQSLAQADKHRQFQMDKARQIQHNLLPKPEQLQNVGIEHVHLPAEDVGGDFFDVKMIDRDRVAICLGDVTGHGVPAAMSAAMLKTLFQNTTADLGNPAAVLDEINRRFHGVTLDGDFATMFLGVIDRREDRLVYASAGHEIGYVIKSGGELVELKATGMLLGIDPEAHCDGAQLDATPGDTIVLLTDGLVETMSPEGKLLGRTAVIEALVQSANDPPHELAVGLLRLAETHRGDRPQLDDITLAVLRV